MAAPRGRPGHLPGHRRDTPLGAGHRQPRQATLRYAVSQFTQKEEFPGLNPSEPAPEPPFSFQVQVDRQTGEVIHFQPPPSLIAGRLHILQLLLHARFAKLPRNGKWTATLPVRGLTIPTREPTVTLAFKMTGQRGGRAGDRPPHGLAGADRDHHQHATEGRVATGRRQAGDEHGDGSDHADHRRTAVIVAAVKIWFRRLTGRRFPDNMVGGTKGSSQPAEHRRVIRSSIRAFSPAILRRKSWRDLRSQPASGVFLNGAGNVVGG